MVRVASRLQLSVSFIFGSSNTFLSNVRYGANEYLDQVTSYTFDDVSGDLSVNNVVCQYLILIFIIFLLW